jgi:hypothetical protein
MTVPFSGGANGFTRSHENFSSKFVETRRVDIWLPPGYDRNPSQCFPVVYKHYGLIMELKPLTRRLNPISSR